MRSPHPSLARPGGGELYCHHDAGLCHSSRNHACGPPTEPSPPSGRPRAGSARTGGQVCGGDAVRLGHTGDGGVGSGGRRRWYGRRHHRSALSQEPRTGHPLQVALGLSVRNASNGSLLLRSRHSCYAPSPVAGRQPAPWAQQQVLLPRGCTSGSPPRRVRIGSARRRRSCPQYSG